MMQIDPSQFVILILTLFFIGVSVVGSILYVLAREEGYVTEEENPPAEWGPTVSAPFRPSDAEMDQVPDKCPACKANLSPYEVKWDESTGEAYCPDCNFPLRRRDR